jgi:hypothetical protein
MPICLVQPGTSRLLATAARDAEQHPFLMAAVLADYRAQTGLTDGALAARLGCSVPALHGLALCRRFAPTDPDIATQVTALATYIGCDPVGLRQLVEGTGRVATSSCSGGSNPRTREGEE